MNFEGYFVMIIYTSWQRNNTIEQFAKFSKQRIQQPKVLGTESLLPF